MEFNQQLNASCNSVNDYNSAFACSDNETFSFPALVELLDESLNNITQTEEIRKRFSEFSQVKIKELTRKLKTAQIKAERPPESSEEAHHKELDNIISQQINISTSLESRVNQIMNDTEKLRNYNVEEESIPPTDITSMLLYIYRNLGIELIEQGNCLKARVQSPTKNDIYTVMIDDKLSEHFVANHLWELAE
ncbi:7742_t:CDS:2 [Ambispora gerdemannii]|uniref:Kinetochore protein Spc24 n=1 Tax=Ambispora gerdemannii TaxID=144530 RepID=A0A9N9AN86_9GLOM|nr:7742_t:CDS:2 [Ambispora gerdemannii]